MQRYWYKNILTLPIIHNIENNLNVTNRRLTNYGISKLWNVVFKKNQVVLNLTWNDDQDILLGEKKMDGAEQYALYDSTIQIWTYKCTWLYLCEWNV